MSIVSWAPPATQSDEVVPEGRVVVPAKGRAQASGDEAPASTPRDTVRPSRIIGAIVTWIPWSWVVPGNIKPIKSPFPHAAC